MIRMRKLLVNGAARIIPPLFHRIFYNAGYSGKTWGNTYWMGVRALKSPLDLWVYQDILFEKRPDLVIETGTAFGGSTLYLAHVMDQLRRGEIITIDIEARPVPEHPRVRYLRASSTDQAVVEEVRRAAEGKTVMVILDSDHSKQHVLNELSVYAPIVTKGQYLVVEDTSINGHPVLKRFGPGPW